MRCALFDLDGTLIDTNGLIIDSFQHVFRSRLGLELAARDITPFFGEPLPRTIARWAPPERVPALVDAYRAYNHEMHDVLTRPIAGVGEMLRALKAAGLKLGVTTSKMTPTALRGLRLFGLEGYFDAIVGMDQTTRHKPEPEPVLTTLERMGEAPGIDCLMVGDSPFDLLAGRAAGVRTVAVAWSALSSDRLTACDPDFWVQSPSDITSLCLEG